MAHNPNIINKTGSVVQILDQIEISGQDIILSASQITASSITTLNLTSSLFNIADNKTGLINLKRNCRIVTSSSTLTSNDQVVLVSASSSPITITLPPVYEIANQEYIIRKIDSTANVVNVVSEVPFTRYSGSISNNGASIGRFSKDGSTIIVGPQIFIKSGSSWALSQLLTASKVDIVTPSGYGDAVAINATGTKVVVCNPVGSNNGSTSPGLAYVYRSASSGWVQEKILLGSKATTDNERFGYSVDMNDTGDCIIIGAILDEYSTVYPNSGLAYVFVSSSNGWTEKAALTGSLAVNGDENFGRAVAINSTATKIAVSAPADDFNVGSFGGLVYVFNSSSVGWRQEAILTASNSSMLGIDVAINDNGDFIVAADAGSGIYTFKSSSSGWLHTFTISDGGLRSIDSTGDIISCGINTYVSKSSGYKKTVPASAGVGGILNSQSTFFVANFGSIDFYDLSGSAFDNLISVTLTTSSNIANVVADNAFNWRII